MTNTAFKEGLAIFTTTFSAIKSDTKTHKVWFMLLKDLTDEQFLYAVTKICRDQTKFFPSDNFAALVREQLKVDIDNEALLAWEAVKRAMAHQGAYCSVKFSDLAIHSVVNIMASGWAEFCQIPLDKWMQKEFEKNYKILSARSEHPEYLKGIHEIDNTANGFAEFMGSYKSPKLIETRTGRHKAIKGHTESSGTPVLKLVESVAEKMKQ